MGHLFYCMFLIESFLCSDSQHKFSFHALFLPIVEVLIYKILIKIYYFIALEPCLYSQANIAQILHFCPQLV